MTKAPRPIPETVERGAEALYERHRKKNLAMQGSTTWRFLCEECKHEYREEASCVMKAAEHGSAGSS